MGREDVLEDMLKEARQEYQQASGRFKQVERYDGESWIHFRRRKKRYKHRRNHLEDVKDHLKKKLEHLQKEKREEKHDDKSLDPNGTKIVYFDGKPVVEKAAYWLTKSRGNGWVGTLVSGYRTPEYSQQLCYRICGAPSCPGLCAGTSSNHTKTTYPGPAVDVSDYTNFERIQYRIGSPLRNYLPHDLVHFSPSGH